MLTVRQIYCKNKHLQDQITQLARGKKPLKASKEAIPKNVLLRKNL